MKGFSCLSKNNHNKKVFLGGTCNGSEWREELIPMLRINYYNPVVEDWTEECMAEERRQRMICDYCLYVITPRMSGVYSIAEVVDDSNKRPGKTIFCILEKDINPFTNLSSDWKIPEYTTFDCSQLKSLNQVGEMVKRNGGQYFTNLDDVAEYLNKGVKQ